MPLSIRLSEKHARFVAYWDAKRGARTMPARRDLDPLIDLSDLIPYLGTMRVEQDRIRYAVLGSSMEEAGGPRTGTYLDETRRPPFLDYLNAMYRLGVARRACVYARNGFVYGDGLTGWTVRVVAPLSSDGTAVDMFIGLQISYDDAGAILPAAWHRTPSFPDALLNDMAWRDETGAWQPVDWRTIQT